MHSAIYSGLLRHRRFFPAAHRFVYRVFMMYLDLDELPQVLQKSRWWSTRRWHPVRFRRSDFLGDAKIDLAQAVRNRIHEEAGVWHRGPIRMLANLRYFGISMNPIVAYYCFDQQEQLKFIVVEVNNTPWGEKVSYLLQCDPDDKFQRIQFEKEMHVSPFNPMNLSYNWCSNNPCKVLTLDLAASSGDQIHTDATMVLKRREIDTGSLRSIVIEYPWMTAKVILAIYWQALRLWLKKVPFYGHPKDRQRKTDKQPLA